MATKKTRTKAAAAAVFVPQSREQVADCIKEMGELQRDLARIEADMNDELSHVREHYETDAEPRKRRVESLLQGVQTWSEANRALLTQNGKTKTAAFTTGEVAWRMNPPSVRLTDTEENVIAACEKAGLKEFVRYSPTLNRDAIKANPDEARHVPGIKIGQAEAFVVTPFEVVLTGVAP